ncbi:MAG: hypothetical protein QXM93_06005 [Candidatus Methanomethyliaceae archaeon]
MMYDLALVLGGGKFGTIAFNVLVRKSRRVIVVDKDPNCHASKALRMVCSDPSKCEVGSRLVVGDAINHAIKIIKAGTIPDIIVPAMPGNSMAMLFTKWVSENGFSVEPEPEMLMKALIEVPKDFIFEEDKSTATLILSHAKDFICSPWCDEPEVCPVTGKKIESVNSILARMSFCSYNKVFRSRLVEKGVGAIDGREVYRELLSLPTELEKYTLCVGTACNCHGIVNFLKVSRRAKS